VDYADWTREDLIRELANRDAAVLAPEEVRRSINLLETIHHAQTDFLTIESGSNIFNKMLDNFLAVTGCQYGFIDELFIQDDGSMYLEARAITDIAWDDGSRAIYKKLVSGEIRFDNMKSLYGEVMRTGEPVIANDAPTDPRRTGIPPGHPPLIGFLGVPLYAGGEFVGMLGLANAPGGFSEGLLVHLEPLTKIAGIILLTLKIDRRRAEAIDAWQRLANKLTASNAELERFAYVCSHDLQAPIRHVTSYATMLGDHVDEAANPDLRRWADKIIAGGRRMQNLVSDLLAYARLSKGAAPVSSVDTNAVVDDVLEVLDKRIDEAGATVRRADLPMLDCHGTLVTQLFQNLIENALRYRRTDVPVSVEISCTDEGAHQHFAVRDNGKGIDPAHHSRTFEIFQRLEGDKDDGGTGIGLAICERVVQMHSGRIWVESEAGAGATFHFTLGESAHEAGPGETR